MKIDKNFYVSHKNLVTTLAFAVVVAVMPLFFANDYLVHVGCMIGINILLALGMHFVTGLAGQINMGQYGFYCIGAYCGALITTKLGMGFLPTLVITIAVSAVCGMLVGIPSLKVEGPYLSLCTIGFAESVRLIINGAGWAGKANGVSRIPKLEIFGFTMQNKVMSYYFIMVFAILGIIIVNNFISSNYGKRFTAIKDDPIASSVIGINVRKVKIMAFVLCAIFAGVAGLLYSNYYGYISPTTFTQTLQINFMLMIVLGGLGSTWGAVLGATLVTVAYEYTRVYADYQKIAFGIVMILIVMFLQRGIVGTINHHKQQKLIRTQHAQEEVAVKEGAK